MRRAEISKRWDGFLVSRRGRDGERERGAKREEMVCEWYGGIKRVVKVKGKSENERKMKRVGGKGGETRLGTATVGD